MSFVKPKRLVPGDTVGIISPSWGGPSVFPYIYESGIKNIESLGLKIKEFPTARMDAKYLYENPKVRAGDVNAAFGDSQVKAIITTIGGNDSVRILPYLDKEIIKANPKMLMGYSDASNLTTFCNKLGLVTFNGPSIMAGFSQYQNQPEAFKKHLNDFLFGDNQEYIYPKFNLYAEGYPDWGDPAKVGLLKELKPATGWRWLQGDKCIQGELFGGCIEVLEMSKGTDYESRGDFWDGKIFFLETSEEKPAPAQVKYMLRNYGMQGVFDRIKGLIFGRPRDYSDEEKRQLDENILAVVRGEFGNKTMTIVSNMDFGHTDPQIILPLGVKAELNSDKQELKLIESPFGG
jgi:muramoyltetrapeptide carboxypeptidase LdcA involved in peptidoglycan recycling